MLFISLTYVTQDLAVNQDGVLLLDALFLDKMLKSSSQKEDAYGTPSIQQWDIMDSVVSTFTAFVFYN